jgi:hypothetical protein
MASQVAGSQRGQGSTWPRGQFHAWLGKVVAIAQTPALPMVLSPKKGRLCQMATQRRDWRCQCVERAAHAGHALLADVRVDHRRVHVGMAKQLLHGANVIAQLQEMRGEAMPQGMTADAFVQPQPTNGGRHGPLHAPLKNVMPPQLAAARIARPLPRSKDKLPFQRSRSRRILDRQGVRQRDPSQAAGQVALV